MNLDFAEAFFLGVLCNGLVCLAVWLTYSARSNLDKALAMVFPITAFVASGYEHSIANMYFIPLGLLLKREDCVLQRPAGTDSAQLATWTWRTSSFDNLLPVTAGNLVGGGLLVGAVYWFVLPAQRPPESVAQPGRQSAVRHEQRLRLAVSDLDRSVGLLGKLHREVALGGVVDAGRDDKRVRPSFAQRLQRLLDAQRSLPAGEGVIDQATAPGRVPAPARPRRLVVAPYRQRRRPWRTSRRGRCRRACPARPA